MLELNTTKRIFAFLGVVTLTAAAVYGFMFWDIRSKNQEVATLSNEITILERREEEFRSIEQVLEETRESRDTLSSYFVHENNVVGFIEFIERMAADRDLSVTFKTVELAEPDADGGSEDGPLVTLLRLSISTGGSRTDTMEFLRLLETMPYKSTITNVQVVQRDGVSSGDGGATDGVGAWQGAFTFTVQTLTDQS